MRYNPIEYWSKRTDINSQPFFKYAKDYIAKHIKDAEKILDFGVGDGRLLPLYKGKTVKGYDIVHRIEGFDYLKALEGKFDAVICSKVLLHVKPNEIAELINTLRAMGKVIVYDTVAECTASHNFNHDFSKFGKMNDIVIKNKDLLFYYD